MSQAELFQSLSEQYRKHLDPSGVQQNDGCTRYGTLATS